MWIYVLKKINGIPADVYDSLTVDFDFVSST